MHPACLCVVASPLECSPLPVPTEAAAAHSPPWLARDRFRTMINVLGDALAAGIMAHICRKDFAQDMGTEVRTVSLQEAAKMAVLSLWVAPPPGLHDPFTGVGLGRQIRISCMSEIRITFVTVANWPLRNGDGNFMVGGKASPQREELNQRVEVLGRLRTRWGCRAPDVPPTRWEAFCHTLHSFRLL